MTRLRILSVFALCLCILALVPFAIYESRNIRSFVSTNENAQAVSEIVEDYSAFKQAFNRALDQPNPAAIQLVQEKLAELELSLQMGFTGLYAGDVSAKYIKTLNDMRHEVNLIHAAVFAPDFLADGTHPALSQSFLQALQSMGGLDLIILNMHAHFPEKTALLDVGSHHTLVFFVELGVACIFLVLLGFMLRFVWLRFGHMHALHVSNIEAARDIQTLRKAMMSSQDGIILLNHDSHVTFINAAAKSMLHIGSEVLQSSDIVVWHDIFDAQTRDIIHAKIEPLLGHKGQWSGSLEGQTAGGQTFDVSLSMARVPDTGFFVLLRDNQVQKRQEQAVDDLRLQYYQAQKMEAVGRMAGGIAHDFNNILAAISGYAQFLLHDLPRSSDTRQFADKILTASHQAQNLVEQLLSFSRRGDSRRISVDMLALLHDVASMVRASAPSMLHIDVAINSTISVLQVHGQATHILQVLMNICLNAIDAMDDHGDLRIACDMVDMSDVFPSSHAVNTGEDIPDVTPLYFKQTGADSAVLSIGCYNPTQQYCRVRIVDTGAGIQPAIMQQIFEPFFTTKGQDKGTGLGLASAHGIVLSHQGLIQVQSKVGAGTTFDLYFPILNGDLPQANTHNNVNDTENAEEASEIVSSGEDDWPIDLPDAKQAAHTRTRVLVVDDQRDVRAMLCLMLERSGYVVFDCISATEALSLLRDNADMVDVILTDYAMPDMTGIAFAVAVQGLIPHVPIILVSGYQSEEMGAENLTNLHIAALIHKPVQAGTLHSVIRGVLARQAAGTGASVF